MRNGTLEIISPIKMGDKLTILSFSRNGEVDVRYVKITGYDCCNKIASIFYINKGGTRKNRELILDRKIIAFEGWIPKVFNGLHRKIYDSEDQLPDELNQLSRSFEFRLKSIEIQ